MLEATINASIYISCQYAVKANGQRVLSIHSHSFSSLSTSEFVICFGIFKIIRTFAPTVHTTLPIRTASQGVSFAFNTFHFNNSPL